ncbi:MAG: WD40 repeat domain-containing protein [Phycisphaerae bacterium]|jgi:WD40 repeat protein
MNIRSRPLLPLIALSASLVLCSPAALAVGQPDIVWQVPGHTNAVNAVNFSADGSLLISGADYDDSSARTWRVADGQPLDTFPGHEWGVQSVGFSADGTRIAVGYIASGYAPGGLANVYDAYTDTELDTVGGAHVAFSADGEFIASGGGGVNRYMYVHRLSDGQQFASVYTGAYLLDLAYSPDGQYVATGGSDNNIKLWNPMTGQLARTLVGHTDDVSAVAFSPDGQLLASGAGGWDEPSDSTIKIWRVSDGTLLRTLTGHGSFVYDLDFSPDGRYLISSGRTNSSSYIRLWRVAAGDQVDYYNQGLSGGVLSVKFSPDGSLFAYGRGTGEVVVARSDLPLAGDLNCDGVVDNFDIAPFTLAISSGPDHEAYYAKYPSCDVTLADLNNDGAVDNFDISAFVASLASN